jgi:hypothetical protein
MRSSRFDVLRQIEALDPVRDHQRIIHLSFGYDFSWDSIRALELALYRTYCVPSISVLLDRTGEFHHDTQRRYDDTSLIMAEICKWGYEHERGREAIARMNWAHGHYKISNDDFLYVLSTFVFEPVRWIDAFGWRQTCLTERLGYYYFWHAVGTRMGIVDIPPSYEQFETWSRDYERARFRFADSNRRVGISTRDLFASWAPPVFAAAVHHTIYALLDDEVLTAFGFPKPRPSTRALVRGALRLRARVIRWLPPRRRPHFFTDSPNRTHPQGYLIGELGPPRLISAAERERSRESNSSVTDRRI